MLNYKRIIFILVLILIFTGTVFANSFSDNLESEVYPAVVSVYTNDTHRNGVFVGPNMVLTDLDVVRSSNDIIVENRHGYKSEVVASYDYYPLSNLIFLKVRTANKSFLNIANDFQYNINQEILFINHSLNSGNNIKKINIEEVINDDMILIDKSVNINDTGSPLINNKNEIVGLLFSKGNNHIDHNNYFLSYKLLKQTLKGIDINNNIPLEKVITGPHNVFVENQFRVNKNQININIKEIWFEDNKLYVNTNFHNGFQDRILTNIPQLNFEIINENNEVIAKSGFSNINVIIPPKNDKNHTLIFNSDGIYKYDDLNGLYWNWGYNTNLNFDRVVFGETLENNKNLRSDELNILGDYFYWNGEKLALLISMFNGHDSTITNIENLYLDVYDKKGKINNKNYLTSGSTEILPHSSKSFILYFSNNNINRSSLESIDFDSIYIDYNINYGF